MSENRNNIQKEVHLDKNDINKTFLVWWLTTELSNSYDRLQGLAFCNALAKPLRKLYSNDKDYTEALTRNIGFYNSEGITGSMIHGITLSMEEEKANGAPIDGSVITSIKTALMGPIAGIGDTLIHGTLKPIILGIACTMAMEGNILGAFFPFLIPLICYFIGRACMNFGYKLGKNSAMKLMQSGIMQHIITGASIMGLFMMGALGSSYVKVKTPLQFTLSNTNTIVVQNILDSIVKGALPLLAIMLIYRYFTKKGANYNKVILAIFALSMICALLGILG